MCVREERKALAQDSSQGLKIVFRQRRKIFRAEQKRVVATAFFGAPGIVVFYGPDFPLERGRRALATELQLYSERHGLPAEGYVAVAIGLDASIDPSVFLESDTSSDLIFMEVKLTIDGVDADRFDKLLEAAANLG